MKPKSAWPAVTLVTGSSFVFLVVMLLNSQTNATPLILIGVTMNMLGFVMMVEWLRTDSARNVPDHR
jgi:hypothetical protein